MAQEGLRCSYVNPIDNRKRLATLVPLTISQESSKLARMDPKLVITSKLSSSSQHRQCDNKNLETAREDHYDMGNLMPHDEEDDIDVFLDDEASSENASARNHNGVLWKNLELVKVAL